jgi:CubicO group peptidase (beta-lactamase class C family)
MLAPPLSLRAAIRSRVSAMKTHLLVLAVLIGCSTCAAAQPGCSDQDRARLDRHISNIIAGPPAVNMGISVAVIRNKQLCYAKGFGNRDRQLGLKVDADTYFAIGSATKSFTSMAVSMLAEDGKIDLDKPIKDYLPDFGLKDANASANTTLVDILSHRTGLRPNDALWYLGPFSTHQQLHRVKHLPHDGQFRQNFLYNNVLVSIGGLVLKARGDSTWDEFVRARIFEPLDMKKCTFSIGDLAGYSNHAKGYNQATLVVPHSMESIRPAGEINCNILELTKWVQLHLNKGIGPDGKALISQASLDKMYAEHNRQDPPSTVLVGLGWFLLKLGVVQKRLLFHPGNAEGYSTVVSFMPDDGLGVIVLTNQHSTGFPQKLMGEIYKHLFLTGAFMSASAPETDMRAGAVLPGQIRLGLKATALPKLLANAGDYQGMFSNAAYGDMTVTLIGNELNLGYYNYRWPLEAGAEADKFTFGLQSFGGNERDVTLTFQRNSAGKVEALSVPFDVINPEDPTTARLVAFAKQP